MDLSKLSQNNWIGIGGGLLALVSGFLPWFGNSGFNLSGFEIGGFWANVGILLAFQAAMILLIKALGTGDMRIGKLNAEQIGMIFAALGALFILLRLLLGIDGAGVQWGLFVGLIGAGAAAAGSFLSAQDKGISLPSADDFTGGGDSGGGSTTF